MPIAVRVRSLMSVVSTAPSASVHDGFQKVDSSSNGVEAGIPKNDLRSGLKAWSTGGGIAAV